MIRTELRGHKKIQFSNAGSVGTNYLPTDEPTSKRNRNTIKNKIQRIL